MFLWGIDGQIWAVLWADFDYKQPRKVVCMSANCCGLQGDSSLIQSVGVASFNEAKIK